ncbi:hypothetical protein DFR24_2117 [Panacagrimonas perspica]|uniref:Cytochrome c domain-containing protein n=1 Tax=Panacagrimonas perspica TaxID=381431 RepID=A0A4R7PF19_9GAMM|nr:hypothetical protein [Panacagrimonas perspica]TDU32717.1 hypothetical protein DFR24_2117 [Panacagrimonas perspica]THD05597.1 hypothetical protein B1810_02455 [Panacagrimonas perspica]
MRSSSRKAIVAAVLMSASFAAAAQSIMPQPRAPSPDRDPRTKRDVPDYRQYEYGKEIYAVKLGCTTCPLGEKPLDETVARRFFEDDTLWETLDRKEYDAVAVYLRQRFGIGS